MNRKLSWLSAILIVFLFSCKKETIEQPDITEEPAVSEDLYDRGSAYTESITGYTTYIIRKGQHYSNIRPFKTISTSEMKFYAKFNQTAIYQTVIPDNQYDINKLWGFSEGYNNQYNSARFGWRYSDEQLRLFGYVYRRGVVYYNEITTVLPGEDVYCSIKVLANSYLFTANGISITLPRGATGTRASGLQQYPYFGGDETAPHDIYIYVKPV